jgi:CHAT domain-containing protein
MDPELLKRAHALLLHTGNLDALQDVLDQEPMFHEPEFHQALLKAIEAGAPEGVRYAYEGLFFLLHVRAHRRRATECANEAQTVQAPTPVYAPAYFLQLSRHLEGRIPPRRDRALSPAVDAELIRHDLREILGPAAVLPEYEPTPGTSWCAVVVACAACGHERLELRAQFIDLKIAPHLLEPLRAGHINSARCQCGCSMSLPERIWLHEGPLPHDVLQSLCCIWVLDESVLVFELPPGTPKDPKLQPMLIGRMQHLVRRLGLEPRGATDEESPSLFLVLAFDQEALLSELDELESAGYSEHQFEVTLDFLTRQLEQKTCSFEDALFVADKLVVERGQPWTASLTFETHDVGGRPLRLVALALLNEAIGRVQGAPIRAQAFFAGNTARALLATGRRGLAEAALARADDLMAQVTPEEQGASLIRSFLLDVRGNLLRHMKRYAEARVLIQAHEPPAPDASLEERFHHQRVLSGQALGSKRDRQYLKAIEAFPACIAGLEALEFEARASADQTVRAQLPAIRSSLSGALANWSSSYVDLADELESTTRAEGGEVGTDTSTGALDPAQLRTRALPLLQRALDISIRENDLRFATIQAHRMGLLQASLGNPAESRIWMQRTCELGETAGDFERLLHASHSLALFGLREGNGAEMLIHTERAAHALLRWLVAEGQNVLKPEVIPQISALALRAADLGADAARAIMVAESLKAARTSLGLRRELPGRLSHSQDERFQSLIRQREQLVTDLDEAMGDESAAVLAELSEIHARLEEARRERSLRDPVYARWCDITDIHLSDVVGLRSRLAILGPRTTFLGLCTALGGLWIYAIWAEGAQVIRVPWEEWPRQLPGLLAALQEDTGRTQEVLELLAEKLVAPFHSRLEGLSRDDRLIISSAPLFHLIPFAALPLHGDPLCARMPISQVQGLGVLEACAEAPQLPLRSVLCVGVASRPGLDKIPYARFEVMDIARTFEEANCSATILLNHEATVPTILSQAHAHDVLHLACHATWRPPEPPRLALQPDYSAGDSGDLTDVRILWELKLAPGALVNLSACESAHQTEGGGDISEGLVPAMLVAGARAVIASLWKIDDRLAHQFQCRLYQYLLTGLTPAMALSKTQRACLSGYLGEEMTRFDIWAAFVLFGFH